MSASRGCRGAGFTSDREVHRAYAEMLSIKTQRDFVNSVAPRLTLRLRTLSQYRHRERTIGTHEPVYPKS